jgi:hypothetical protein
MEASIRRLLSIDPATLLAVWIRNVCVSARGSYTAAGVEPTTCASRLSCINELVLVMSTQLQSLGSEQLAYPVDALLTVLKEKAERNGCLGDLEWGAQRAIAHFEA